jgi:hypothetical protein
MNVLFAQPPEVESCVDDAKSFLALIGPDCVTVPAAVTAELNICTYLSVLRSDVSSDSRNTLDQYVTSAQHRAFVVLSGNARFFSGNPTMRFLELRQLESGDVPLISVVGSFRVRVSISDETNFATKTIEFVVPAV